MGIVDAHTLNLVVCSHYKDIVWYIEEEEKEEIVASFIEILDSKVITRRYLFEKDSMEEDHTIYTLYKETNCWSCFSFEY